MDDVQLLEKKRSSLLEGQIALGKETNFFVSTVWSLKGKILENRYTMNRSTELFLWCSIGILGKINSQATKTVRWRSQETPLWTG